MITGKLSIGVKRNGSWSGNVHDLPDLFILEFLEDEKVLLMNHKAIMGISRNELACCLREVLSIIEENDPC